MTYTSLLAAIVASRGLSPETVATESLVHLLETSEAARRATEGILVQLCPGLPPNLHWIREVRGDDDARPDLVGMDASGARVVLEAKFDAGLTEAQMGPHYRERLQEGRPGLLAFLMPAERVTGMWPTLVAGPGGLDGSLPIDAARAGDGMLVQDLGDGRRLAAFSWNLLLQTIRSACKDTDESDLRQLEGLVTWYADHEQWLPFAPGDLDRRAGRQFRAALSAVKEAGTLLANSGCQLREDRTYNNFGYYLTSETGTYVWVGIWLGQWARYGISPVWVNAKPQHSWSQAQLRIVLSSIENDEPGLWPTRGSGWASPVVFPPGGDRDAAVHQIVESTKRMLALLDAAR
ncbi:hypothetical protein [Micromonospora sp. NPDC005299]|uniref:hypothetical protein n=1 Tax=Micromonospora sp. NPDC005299 TaxID=3364231 RepID=UPI0036A940FB